MDGSSNFTDDAWTLQENNIITITSTDLAAGCLQDFNEMWKTGKIKGSGRHDGGTIAIGDVKAPWDFAPGDGRAVDTALVDLVTGSSGRLTVGRWC